MPAPVRLVKNMPALFAAASYRFVNPFDAIRPGSFLRGRRRFWQIGFFSPAQAVFPFCRRSFPPPPATCGKHRRNSFTPSVVSFVGYFLHRDARLFEIVHRFLRGGHVFGEAVAAPAVIAEASTVAGGIVSTVSGPINSSTYMTSRYAGFFRAGAGP